MAETRYQLEGNAPQLYERETVHTLGRPLAERMLAHVALHAGDRVLDAACGTGIVTRVAVQRYGDLGHVVGVDLNAGMLDVARANSPATHVPIEWQQADVCAFPFPDSARHNILYLSAQRSRPCAEARAPGRIDRKMLSVCLYLTVRPTTRAWI